MKTFALLLASRTTKTGIGEREKSMEDRRKVPGRMQNAKHLDVLPDSSVEDEIELKTSDRQPQ
jgi:hypothetical protein